MKIKLNELRRMIREEVAAAAGHPQDGDTFVWVDDYTGKVNYSDIYAGGDLATANYDDMGEYDPNGPQPGEPGVWFVDAMGMGRQFRPGDLVKVPGHTGAGTAWASKNSLPKIEAGKKKAAAKNPVDKAMLHMLSAVTTEGVDMTDIPDFSIRLRKDGIVFRFDPGGDPGIEGVISQSWVKGVLASLGLPGIAEWLFTNGAQKLKPQKRSPSYSVFD